MELEFDSSTYASYQDSANELANSFASSESCDTRKDEGCRQRFIAKTDTAIDTWVKATGYNPLAVLFGEALKQYVRWGTKYGRAAGGGDNTIYHHENFPYLPVLITRWTPCGPPDSDEVFWCYRAHDGITLNQLAATYMPAPGQVPYDSPSAPYPTVVRSIELWQKQTNDLQVKLGEVDPLYVPLQDGELVVMPLEAVQNARKQGLPKLTKPMLSGGHAGRLVSRMSAPKAVVVGTAVLGVGAAVGWAGWTYLYPALKELVSSGIQRTVR